MSDLRPHEAAGLFPMMDQARYEELRESMRTHGLREPITLYDGQILDGRNRYKACKELGIEPRFRTHDEGDPYAYAWDLNGNRRDLTGMQRALIGLAAREKSHEWLSLREQIQEGATRRRREAAEKRPREAGRFISGGTMCAATGGHPHREAMAEGFGVNRGDVQRAMQLQKHRPDLAKKVIHGELKGREALGIMRRDRVPSQCAELPEGTYRVIYADPPWKHTNDFSAAMMGSTPRDHYQTMSIDELCRLNVRELAADNAVLFLWVPSPMLEECFPVIRAWGFRYKSSIVWDKIKHHFGHYVSVRTEYLLICVRGACTPDVSMQPDNVLSIEKSRTHSQKPEEFRQMIDALYAHGPRIELFRRGPAPQGWEAWGNEVDIPESSRCEAAVSIRGN